MRLDAWADQQQEQRRTTRDPYRDFVPGYDPDEDKTYDVAWKRDYTADLQLASQSYWTQETGSPTPPPPSYQTDRAWDLGWTSAADKRRLGRLMDVYGCQAMMRSARHQYQSRFYAAVIGCVISLGAFAAGGGVGVAAGIVVALLFGAPLCAFIRHHYNGIYRRYYYAQEKILKTGKPVWVAYSRGDLRRIKNTAGPIWP